MLADIYKTGGTLMIERFSERCVSVYVKRDISHKIYYSSNRRLSQKESLFESYLIYFVTVG